MGIYRAEREPCVPVDIDVTDILARLVPCTRKLRRDIERYRLRVSTTFLRRCRGNRSLRAGLIALSKFYRIYLERGRLGESRRVRALEHRLGISGSMFRTRDCFFVFFREQRNV